MLEPTFVHEGNQPTDEFFENASRTMSQAIGVLLEQDGLAAPLLRIVTTPDVMAAASTENERLGLGPDRRTGIERVGGVVAGKCLVSDDGREASILLSDDVLLATEGLGKLHAAKIIAHELGHLAYGASRISAIGKFADVGLPWQVSGMIAVVASEEYRVDRMATMICALALTPTDDAGEPVDPASIIFPGYFDGLPAALDELSPGLEDTIWKYRIGNISLDDMWNSVVTISEGMTIYLAHTEAHHNDDIAAVEQLDHRAVELLEPLWRPLFGHLRAGGLLLQSDAWADDRAELIDIGRTGFTEVWKRLGIVATPHEDTFHLAVNDPTF